MIARWKCGIYHLFSAVEDVLELILLDDEVFLFVVRQEAETEQKDEDEEDDSAAGEMLGFLLLDRGCGGHGLFRFWLWSRFLGLFRFVLLLSHRFRLVFFYFG